MKRRRPPPGPSAAAQSGVPEPEPGPSRTVERIGVAVVAWCGREGAPYYLVSRRPPGTRLAGCWEFPGGRAEEGETEAECAIRELWEETGVEARPNSLILRLDHRYPDVDLRLEFHLCGYERGTPGPAGNAGVRWVRAGHLECYEFPPATAPVLAILAAKHPFGQV